MHVFSRSRRLTAVVAAVALSVVLAGVALAAGRPSISTFTPKSASQITNIDVLRQQIKNYYGVPLATTGSGTTSAVNWTTALNLKSNYAKEASSVAAAAERWLAAYAHVPDAKTKAIVLDVDDTTLATWNYELYSNWDYNPSTNASFVIGGLFPSVPGMVNLVKDATNLGYQVIYITGRPTSQEDATISNLTGSPLSPGALGQPGIDAGYPDLVNLSNGTDPLFTKPAVGAYPDYLNKPQFCGPAITAGVSCATIQYKSGTRAYIESLGYDIVANFGDQYSDLTGGYANRDFKLPNPNYYLP